MLRSRLNVFWVGSAALFLSAGAPCQTTTRVSVETGGPVDPGPFSGKLTESWANAVVGARWRLPISETWQVALQADVGAGNADLDWSALGTVTYRFNHAVGLTAGYRVLGVDYRPNGGFVYDIIQHGLLLGVNLRY